MGHPDRLKVRTEVVCQLIAHSLVVHPAGRMTGSTRLSAWGARRRPGGAGKPRREVIREGLGCTGFNGAGSPANNTAGACPPSARCWLSQSAAAASPVSGGLNPTYPFIAGDGSKVFPRVKRPGVRTERVAQVCWYLVHHAGRDLSSSHCPFTTRFREGLETPPSMAGRRVARTSIGSTGGYQTRQVSAPRPLPAEAATPSM